VFLVLLFFGGLFFSFKRSMNILEKELYESPEEETTRGGVTAARFTTFFQDGI